MKEDEKYSGLSLQMWHDKITRVLEQKEKTGDSKKGRKNGGKRARRKGTYVRMAQVLCSAGCKL